MLQRTRGGSKETELKLLIVIPTFAPLLSTAVTTATPVAKQPIARRYSARSISFDDNGNPFSSVQAMFGLSQLSVWWLRLGISIERIKPGHPEQNGRHERMHLTLKKEATKPAGQNLLQQQEKFDSFIEEYNNDRPHEALEMKYPGELYKPSTRVYDGLPDIEYPLHDKVVTVSRCGRICLEGRKINFSRVFAGQDVGITQVDDRIWKVSFMSYDVGFFDEKAARAEPGNDPFGAKVLPM